MTTRATLPTDISPPHIPISCNVRVALRMGPRGVRSCSTCYMICLGRTKTLTIRLFSSTLTSGMPFRKCAVRLPSTHSWVSRLSWVTSGPCTALSAPIGLLTTVDALITSLALPEASKVMGWKWDVTVCLSTPSGAGCSPVMSAREGQLLLMTRTFMPLSKLPCRCSPRFANGFGKTRNCVSIMSKLKIYIPGVSRERARELILQHIDNDPSLESLRELYDLDTADPVLGIINVTGLKCVGVPIGTSETKSRGFFLQSGRLAIACFFICSPLGHSLLRPRDFVVTLHCSPRLCHIIILL